MANIKEKTEALNKALEAISEEEMQEVAGGLSKGGKIALKTASSIIGVGAAATVVGLGIAGYKDKGPLKGLFNKKAGKTPTAGTPTPANRIASPEQYVAGNDYDPADFDTNDPASPYYDPSH